MEELLREYLPILVFLAVAIGLGLVLILAAVVMPGLSNTRRKAQEAALKANLMN